MIYMNKELAKLKKKQYQFFPLQNNTVLKHDLTEDKISKSFREENAITLARYATYLNFSFNGTLASCTILRTKISKLLKKLGNNELNFKFS